MRAAFPWMGNIHIPLAALFRALGAEPVVPPPPNAETVARGVRLAPEMMCIPFKITLGNFIRALELGADTLVYSNGSWSCRFGYYFRLHEAILRDLGYRFRVVVLRGDELPLAFRSVIRLSQGRLSKALMRSIQAIRIGWLKSSLLDLVERWSRWYRPREAVAGTTTRTAASLLARLDATDSAAEIARLRRTARQEFERIGIVPDRNPLRIRVIGESFCLLEPSVNLNLLERLGTMGVWADPFLTTHHWLGFHSLRLGDRRRQELLRPARRYWRYNVGGEDENAVAYMLDAARKGYDGVLHLHPFGCMPGAVVGPTLQRISREYDLPLLDLALDEHTAEAGLYTRVEAFVGVLGKRRRNSKPCSPG
ncbi:MAG: hypothetical protein ABIK62_01935 [candidate division WOR-3 bacterium]